MALRQARLDVLEKLSDPMDTRLAQLSDLPPPDVGRLGHRLLDRGLGRVHQGEPIDPGSIP